MFFENTYIYFDSLYTQLKQSMSQEATSYIQNSISRGVYHQHRRVLEVQRDYRKQATGKRLTTYNQYQKSGGKNWQQFKQKSSS